MNAMREKNCRSKITDILFLTVVFMAGMWAVDIGVSAMLMQGNAVGLFGARDGITQYHIGLIVSIVSFFLLSAVAARGVLNERKK